MAWKRLFRAALIAVVTSLMVTVTVLATFTYSGYTGPTVIQNNGDGTWNVQWTITVTQLDGNDNTVCVTTSTGQVGTCGTTTGTLTCTANNVPNSSTVAWDISSYSGSCGSNSKKTQGPTGTISPLAITLASMNAAQQGNSIDVTWETVSEIGNTGFNLYRDTLAAGPGTKLSSNLIPSQGPGSPSGFTYSYTDANHLVPGTTYYYWLEDVSEGGVATQHEPISVPYDGAPTAVALDHFAGGPAVTWPLVAVGAVALLALAWIAARRALAAR